MEPERLEDVPRIPVSRTPLFNEAIFDQFMARTEFRSFAAETQERFQAITDRFSGLEQTLQQLREMLIGRFAPVPIETESVVPEPQPEPMVPTPAEGPTPSEQVRLTTKDLQNLTYSGEEKERTVDCVTTFLQNWSDYHSLTGTPDHLRSTTTGLFLRGKSAKWWLSLSKNDKRPKTWAEFKNLFEKEHLPENEEDYNWTLGRVQDGKSHSYPIPLQLQRGHAQTLHG